MPSKVSEQLDFPTRHVSIRVPWHDAGWQGTVCRAPQLNGACAKLKGIAGSKQDALETQVAGMSLEALEQRQWPPCVNERATFMAPFELQVLKQHALAGVDKEHYGHFLPTPQRYPAYSAGVVPFRWMMKEHMAAFAELLEVDVDDDREPELKYDSAWVHEGGNQAALLDAFAGHLRPEESLCLFYAKHVPFVEGTGRVLIGAGRIKALGPLTEYDRKDGGMRGMVWERPIQHSIRPNGKDGFLMPYQELLKRAESEPELSLERYTAQAPSEHWEEFSYASELVTHDGAIAGLLSMDAALAAMQDELGLDTEGQRQWIRDELVRLWKVRGPYPGLGAVLSAFGLSRGIFLAHALQHGAGDNADPWPGVDQAFADLGAKLPPALRRDLKELAPIWKKLSDERRAFLKLLSRFELTVEQAEAYYEDGSRKKKGWQVSDRAILQNPYLLYETSRHDPDGIRLLSVDRGVFPDDVVRLQHPLDPPSQLDSPLDLRRIRAFCVDALEAASDGGNTLLTKDQLVEAVRRYPVRPECPVTGDILAARANEMGPVVKPVLAGETEGFQLDRYVDIAALVKKQVLGRVGGQRHALAKDWRALLDAKFGATVDAEEDRARQEKAAALAELAEARFSVLVGPAGAGKTTVLGLLCAQPQITNDGLLLLAPTGKARVRMQELAGAGGAKAYTIAQFLNQNGRYDGASGRYVLSDAPKASGYGTVIVDECSMLTEDMLGALFDALQGVKRFVFVGDPAQLPPIGAGRPFVDILAELRPQDAECKFPRVAPGYAELTIERRQIGTERADLRLARWFSATPPAAGEDDVFSAADDEHSTIRFVEWKAPEDFQSQLIDVLVQELKLEGPEDIRGFNIAMGATAAGDYDYFNSTKQGKPGAVQAVEAWQILSPLRGMPFGVGDVNRQVHAQFRKGFLELATRPWRSIPKPMGSERVVYGDKVINVANHRRAGKRVYPENGALGYLANGEIGVTVGQWKSRGNPKILHAEFSSQPGYTYSFFGNDFAEEGGAALELAYALTVHKSQGSQFKLVILVLPEGHPILSRELIYTALTRHQDRVVVMHQGPRSQLKDFTGMHRSETARRQTSLLRPCSMQEFPQPKGSTFLQEGLVHRTSTGLAVRSKSELVIFEALRSAGVNPVYEKPLMLDGQTRYPDFTIDDEISGRLIYWEHLGMLEREDYRRGWEKKLAWYRRNGVLPPEEGPGPAGMLLTSTESSATGLDLVQVQRLIRDHLQ